jgi:uncharacterized protein
MTISMYKTSVPIFVQFLTSMSAVFDKAAAHCEAKKIEPATLLNMRLYPDMFPLVRQLRAVTDHAISGTARLAGAELITFPNNEASFPEVKDRIAKAIDFVKSFKPAQIDGTEDREIVVKFSSGERKFKGQAFLLNFCLPNFYFHATTAPLWHRARQARFHGNASQSLAGPANQISAARRASTAGQSQTCQAAIAISR